MAARQDQTIVIVNIALILVALGFAVATYFGFKGKSEANQKFDATNTRLTEAQSQLQSKQTDNEKLRVQIGVGANDTTLAVDDAFKADMTKAVPGFDPTKPESSSYRSALNDLFARYKSVETSEAKKSQDLIDLGLRMTAIQTESGKQIKAVESERNKAQEAAAAQLAKFNEDRAANAKVQANLLATLDQQKSGYEEQITARDSRIKMLEDQVGKMQHSIDDLLQRLKPIPSSYEVPDGNVVSVNQRGTVWVNLGSADALRTLVTFGVYDSDAQNAAKAKEKGTIEITRVLDEHLAEARVTSDDPKNPIIHGDRIYSPAWHRGKQLHFALTGIVDVDGDGQNDLQLVRNLITLNGGVVDAYLSDDGTVEGTMSVNTRYLILGKVPEGVLRTKQSDGWQVMLREASTLGIENLTLDQFLDQIGYRPDTRAVRLGPGATARDFPARQFSEQPAAGALAMPSKFRPRTPPPSETTPKQAPLPASGK